jgi:beta-glucosidase-like glycosyl hydrolase
MSDDEAAGALANPSQLVFPGFQFGQDDPARALSLVKRGVGGFCLYGGEVGQIADFTTRLQAGAEAPLLFCADYENGAASHCKGATALPTNMGIGASGRVGLAELKAEITAKEAVALGVRWILAPVIDLAVEPGNPIVNVRSFAADPGLVTRMARSYLAGLRRHRVLGCIKHFPGHGRTCRDSHLELPSVRSPRTLLEKSDLAPYRALSARTDSVMLGHLAVPSLGGGREPFSLSPAASRLLRGKLGFQGLVSTDALDMRAISKHYDEVDAAVRALRAGSDLLLVPKDPERLLADLPAAIARARLGLLAQAALARLRRAKARAGLFGGHPGSVTKSLSVVGGPKHQKQAQSMAELCLAWHGRAVSLKSRRISYAEPGTGPEGWEGLEFLKELRRLGASVRPASGATRPGEVLVMGIFRRPRAYSGHISMGPAQARTALRLARQAEVAVVVPFGNPFVLVDLPGLSGLCAFCGNDAAQRAAAKALSGRIPVTGNMPVILGSRV